MRAKSDQRSTREDIDVCLHLWVEEAHVRLHHANGLVECLRRVCVCPLRVRQDCSQRQFHILRLQICCEAIAYAFILTGGDLDVELGRTEVADDLISIAAIAITQ